MVPFAFLIVLLAFAGVVILSIRAWLRWRGTRLVSCPETGQPVAVAISTSSSMLTALGGPLQLSQCSRWPERQHCGQECLGQIEAAPESCLVRNILACWYRGKSCVYCGRPLEAHTLEHKPCLLSPAQHTLEWKEVVPEQIPQVLATHRPVCWNCHISETFRRQFPDLVTDREN